MKIRCYADDSVLFDIILQDSDLVVLSQRSCSHEPSTRAFLWGGNQCARAQLERVLNPDIRGHSSILSLFADSEATHQSGGLKNLQVNFLIS